MEIHIRENEELTIFAKGPNGEEKTFSISYLEMMHRGETIRDGLTEGEVDSLRLRRKIAAIKSVRARTRMGLKEAKEAVELWIERNQCCRDWPWCQHMKPIEHLDINLLVCERKQLHFVWSYPAELTEEQCQIFQSLNGYLPNLYGFYSFIVEDGKTKWASNNSLRNGSE